MECMEILFSLFGGFACFRLCLKHWSKDLHRFFFHKSHEYLSLCDSFSLIDCTVGILLFFWGGEERWDFEYLGLEEMYRSLKCNFE